LNYGDIEDDEIVSGDEENFVPAEDVATEVDESTEIEPVVDPDPLAEVVAAPDRVDIADMPQSEPINAVPIEQTQFGIEEKPKPQTSAWQRILNLFGGSSDVTARLNKLTHAIEDAPEASVNYVLRAELYMHLREYALAQTDFQRGYELADLQFDMADWGLLEQAMRDRALTGLDKVKRRLR